MLLTSKHSFSRLLPLGLFAFALIVSCSECDPELVRSRQLLRDLGTCSASYVEQSALSEQRLASIIDIGCFSDTEKQEARALIPLIGKDLVQFRALDPAKLADGEADQVKKDAIALEAQFRTIADAYQNLQEHFGYCRTKHILVSDKKGEVFEKGSAEEQDKLFLHVVGDVFGKESGFEGFDESKTLAHRTNALRVIRDQMKGHVFIADRKQTRPCYGMAIATLPEGGTPHPDISQELLEQLLLQAEKAEALITVFRSDDVGALQRVLQTQLGELRPGESIFLPAGWSKHAVIYQITKEETKNNAPARYTFRIFNSGEGIETYHTSSMTGYQNQYFPFVEVKAISYENMTNLVFLKSLKEIAAPAFSSKPQDFYEKLLNQLEGKEQEIPYGAALFEDPQQAGTCTYFATPWVLSDSVSQFAKGDKAKSEFIPEQIEFLINLKTVKDYSGNLQKEGFERVGAMRRNLLKKGLTYFAEQAAGANRGNAVDLGSLGVAVGIMQPVSENVVEAERALENKAAQNTQFKPEQYKTQALKGLGQAVDGAQLIDALAKDVQGQVFAYSLKDWEAPKDRGKLIKELNRRYDDLFEEARKGHNDVVVQSVESIALALPLEEGQWNPTSDYQAQQLISVLRKLDEIYLYSYLAQINANERESRQVSAIAYLVSLKLLTVSDLLNTNYVTSLNPKIPSMYQNHIGEFLLGDLSIFELTDPKWHWQTTLLRKYYEKEAEKNKNGGFISFFGFEQNPTGATAERRFYYDPASPPLVEDELWSIKINWPDLQWVEQWLQAEPRYRSWMSGEISANDSWLGAATNHESIPPYTFNCHPPEGYYPVCPPSWSYTPVKRVEHPSTGEDILRRRQAIRILGENRAGSFPDALPGPFHELRSLSFVTDFLLTANLSLWQSPSLDKGIDVKLLTGDKPYGVIDPRRTCVCQMTEYDWVPDPSRPGYFKGDHPHKVPKPGTISKSTTFRYANLNYRIFGQASGAPDFTRFSQNNELITETDKMRVEGQPFQYVSPYLYLKNASKPFKKYESDQDRAEWHHKELVKLFSTGFDEGGALEKPNQAPTRRRILPNNLVLTTPAKEALQNLSLERMRHLFGLSAFKGDQLVQTLGYFSKNAGLLSLPEYQRMFEKLMMEPSLILDQLQVSNDNTRLFVNQLSNFCRQRFEIFKRYGDYRGMAFILQMNQLFKNEVDFGRTLASSKFQTMFSPVFLNTQGALFDLVKGLKPKQLNEKSFLYRNLAESLLHVDKLSERDVELLLTAMIEHKTIAITDKSFEDRFAEASIKDILGTHSKSIQDVLSGANGADVLDAVLANIRPDLKAKPHSAWRANGTIFQTAFSSPRANIQIDVKNGILYDSGNSSVLFPIVASEYESVFGKTDHPEYVNRISVDAYKWTTNGLEKRVLRTGTGFIFQQEISHGNWYQFMPDAEVQALGDSKAFFWNHDHWKSLDGAKIRVLDKESKELRYEITLSLGNHVEKVERLSDHAILTDAADDSAYQIFAHIEDWRHIYIWTDQATHTVKEVELPRLGLTFPRLDETAFGCAKWKDLQVIPSRQFSRALGAPVTYVLCEAKVDPATKPRLAIFTMNKLAPTQGSSLSQDFKNTSLSFATSRALNYFTYDIDDLAAERAVLPHSHAARYYLALRYLWQQQYRQAAEQIRGNESELGALKKADKEILLWIAQGNDRDHDPRAFAIRLLAESWLAKDLAFRGKFLFPDSSESDQSATALYALYVTAYLQQLTHVDQELLGLYNEKQLADKLLAYIPILRGKEKDADRQRELDNRATRIKNRLAAIALALKGQAYSPNIVVIEQGEAKLKYADSILAADQQTALQAMGDLFLNEGTVEASIPLRSALNAVGMMTADNFSLLYQIVAGDDFDLEAAKRILEPILGVGPVASLGKEEIRRQFLPLIRMAALVDKEEENNEDETTKTLRKRARFLQSVAYAKANGVALRSGAQVKNSFQEIRRKFERVEDLERQLQAKSFEISNLNERKWSYNGQPLTDYELRSIDAQISQLERELQELSRQISELRTQIGDEQSGLFSFFNSVKSADKNEHKLIRTKVNAEQVAMQGSKKPLIPKPTQDILNAELTLAETAKNDPLLKPIFSPALFINGPLNVITISELTATQKDEILNAAKSLNDVFDKAKGAPEDIKKAVKALQGKITAHAQSLLISQKFYGVKKWAELENISKNLKAKIPDDKKALQKLREEALVLGRKYAGRIGPGAYNQILHFADVGKQVEFDDLLYLLVKRSLLPYYELSGALELQELKTLHEKLVTYLMRSTYIQHAQRVADAIDVVVKRHSSGADQKSGEMQQLLENMVLAGTDTRHYDIAQHIEYLVFENDMGILIRQDQAKNLDELDIKQGKITNEKALGAVLEMIMGAGKTTVLLPLLTMLDTKGEWLNVIILPESLLASMSRDLAARLGTAFGRAVDVVHSSRQQYLAEPDLQLLYGRLERARLEGRTIVTTNSDIQSLFLSFVDRLHRFEKSKNQLRGEVEQFANIFRFLRQYGRLTIDEIDLALDILQAHQFSVGDALSLAASPILQTLPATAMSLYNLIATTPALHNEVAQALTATSYKTFKPKLIEAVLKADPFFLGYKHLNKLFRDFLAIDQNRTLAHAYLLSETSSMREPLFAQIDRSASSKDNANRLKDIFAVLHEELNATFLLTASKKLGVHYGVLPRPDRKEEEPDEDFGVRLKTYEAGRFIAIPYHSGEPMVNSRFGTPLEALNYTIQMSLERRAYRDLVKAEVEALKNMALKARQRDNKSFQERFDKLAGKDSGYVITNISEDDIDNINAYVGKPENTSVQMELITRFVMPQITVYPVQLQTNAQIYESLFHSVQGFSGTLWSADTFPNIFREPKYSDTTEKTFLILWQDYLEQKAQPSAQPSVKKLVRDTLPKLIDEIYKDWRTPGSFMDEAGIFRAFSNEEVARSILAHGSVQSATNIQDVIFYDAANNVRILDKSGALSDLDDLRSRRLQSVAFWDKKHTTGSDLKLRPDMQAKLAFDHHLSSRGLQQSVWRLRGLGMGQKIVQSVVLTDDFDIIQSRLTNEWRVPVETQPDLGTVILYAVLNQEARLGELRFRALKQKMKNVIVARMLNQALAPGVSADSIGQLYASVNHSSNGLFEKHLDQDALYLSIGLPKHEQGIDFAINHERKNILEAAFTKALGGSSFNEVIGKLITEEEPLLPRQIVTSNVESGEEVEIETEQEQEQEQEEEQELEAEQFNVDEQHVAHPVLSWALNSPQVFQKGFFSPVSTAQFETKPDAWLLNQTTQQPLVSLPDALRYKGRDFLAQAFDPSIFLSFNFAPLHHKNRFTTQQSHYEYDFFTFYHKPVTDVLVVKEKGTGNIKLVILDGNDVDQWNRFLAADTPAATANRETEIALYNLETGVYRQGADPVDVESNLQFSRLLTQVKFFAGYVNYRDNELPILKTFIEGPNPSDVAAKTSHARTMLNLFRGDILKLKRDSMRLFHGSDIEDIFTDILGKLD